MSNIVETTNQHCFDHMIVAIFDQAGSQRFLHSTVPGAVYTIIEYHLSL